MTSTQQRARALLAEVNAAGNCVNPIRLSGETINLATGEVRRANLKVPCKDRRSVVCPPCSYLYKADAFIIVATGLRGGKGVTESVEHHPKLFVTLTAPSFGPVHSRDSSSGVCKSRVRREYCPHDRPLWCSLVHDNDGQLGSPLCDQCFDYRGSVLWNAHVSLLWHRTLISLRRSLAARHHLLEREFNAQAQLNYLKIAEIQRRGLIHVHAVFRLDGPEGPNSPPPPWFTTDRFMQSMAHVIRETLVEGVEGEALSWGSQFDIQNLVTAADNGQKVTAYLAKYTTKSTDDSANFAHRFNSRQQIEFLRSNDHVRRLALIAWDLGSEPGLASLKLREHAHTLGFRSHLITKSRNYSITFAKLRNARTEYQSRQTSLNPIQGSFLYDGRGYDNPSSSRLAETMFAMMKELRHEKAQRLEIEKDSVDEARSDEVLPERVPS